jgi:alanine racemase
VTNAFAQAPGTLVPTVEDCILAPNSLAEVTRARNAWVQVDLGALEHNVRALRAVIGPDVELIAVVKANAYGAGAAGVVPALEAAGVDRLAVVWVDEAVALRGLGVRLPIIVLGHSFPEDAAIAVQHDITVTVETVAQGMALSRAAAERGARATVHLHIDTGLHRDGLTPEEGIALAEALRRLPALQVEGLSTHMANADEADDSFSKRQQALFAATAERLSWVPYRHTANSATALRHPEARFQGVRVGLALHGIQPENTPAAGLRPILSVRARVARLVDVAAGEGASYGLTWRAAERSRLALIPVGYADGWRRSLGNNGSVLIGGRRCRMVGRVCMDQFLADVTGLPDVAVGDEAVLLGSQGCETITAEEVARLTGTIPWETFAALQARLPRIYHRDGVVVG